MGAIEESPYRRAVRIFIQDVKESKYKGGGFYEKNYFVGHCVSNGFVADYC